MTTPRPSASHSRQDSAAEQTPAAGLLLPTALPESLPPLPPPETFDFLPPLYALLRRLNQPSGLDQRPSAPQDSAAGALGNGISPSQQQNLERVPTGGGRLELHELGSAASAIKLKIQRARTAIAGLADVERTVDEQWEEIEELEARVERQRAMLRKLGVNLDFEDEMDVR